MHKSTHYWVCCVPSCENWHFSYLSEVATKNVLIIKICFHFHVVQYLPRPFEKLGKGPEYPLYMHWDNHLTYNATLVPIFTTLTYHCSDVGDSANKPYKIAPTYMHAQKRVCCVPSCENWHFSYLSEVATKNVPIVKFDFTFHQDVHY